jgi:hypothetical protein
MTIRGKASDKDGEIVAYEWAKTYGGRFSFSGENTSEVRIFNLHAGVYIFRLRAKDNKGGTKDDYFKITVKSAGKDAEGPQKPGDENMLPYAYAGPDRVITLPTNSLTIQSKASDKDGKIVGYQWTKTYGNRATISGARSPQARISDLQRGVYIFRLTVRDNDGGVKHDYFKVTVQASKAVASK